MEFKGVEVAGGGNGTCDGVRQRTTASPTLQHHRAGPEPQLKADLADVCGVEDLRAVGECLCPQLWRRVQHSHPVLAVGSGYLTERQSQVYLSVSTGEVNVIGLL